MKLPSFLTLLMLTGCGACKSTPPAETAPKDLAEKGVVLDGPEDGATVRGRWISVSGWFDPAEIAFVSVVGAPVEEFYEPTGHVGVPSVTVTFRKDGRFFAPRVPVAEGSNRITVIALSRQMRPLGPIHRTVTATDVTSVPATVVAEPQQGKPGVPVRLRASIGTATERKWQWDFDGDGTFDEESAEASHAWPNPGRYQVVARTQVEGAWVYGTTRFAVTADAAVLHSTREVQNPTLLRVFPFDPPERPRFVAAIDGQAVKIFDADLKLLRTLQGLTRPVDVHIDGEGRATVLDPGANALVRFDVSGALDASFGASGKLTVPAWSEAIGFRVWESGLDVKLADGSEHFVSRDPDGGMRLGDPEPYRGADSYEARARCGFQPPFRSPGRDVEGGKICRTFSIAPITVSRSGVTFVDYAEGPQLIVGDFWALDSTGKLHLFRIGSFEATYALEYPVTALASGGDGRLYTAGVGVLEQRALPQLRRSANQ
ncbi:MAG: PKD domain-containing protein [Archangium sp.]|nr:PKD domain-containing protein [Archangium sp.]